MKKTFLFLAIFSIICLAQVIEATKQCSNNPADWCKSFEEAEACNVRLYRYKIERFFV